ncbi:MAG: LamG-like jellyroll fold domain-containing protein [Patescibacteria group bacterium]
MARLRKKRKKQNKGIIKTSVLKIIALLVIIGLNWIGLSAISETSAFFFNTKDSSANTFTAATLDFSLTGSDFSPSSLNPGESATRNIIIQKDGSLGFQYKINYEKVSGNLCDYLDLTAGAYSGLLKDFTDQGPFTFSGIPSWNFVVSLPLGVSDDLQGEVCDFNFVFNAWQDNLTYLSGGFTDTEKLGSIIKAGYWNPPIVLNEFLPNAGEYPEFVEIYNKTASPINLNGFYIKANDNIIPIDTTTTHDYSGGSTTIPANGWLVVTAGGDLINNSFGTIALYNGNNVLVDSYTYGSSDHNINNTPGWTNNLVGYWPFDGGFEDKSGTGNNGINYGATSVDGKINQALSFDGTNDYVEIADSATLKPTSITLEMWVKANSPGSYKYIASKFYNSDHASYAFYTASSGGLRFYIGHAGGYILSPDAGTGIWDNNWHHVVGTYDGSKVRLYVDGVEKGTGTLTTVGITYNTNKFYVGSYGNGFYFNGIIDEAKIYDRALSADEALKHYNDVDFSGAVPLDKSYARIPDGVGDWIDPMPTPGRANILEGEQEPIANLQSENPSVFPSFSEILGSTVSAITEFISGGEEATTTPEEMPIIEETATTTEATTTPEIITVPETATTTPEITPDPEIIPVAVEETLAEESVIEEISPAIKENPPVIEPVPTQEESTPPPADPPAPAPTE